MDSYDPELTLQLIDAVKHMTANKDVEVRSISIKIQDLLEAGADPNAKDKDDNTCLHYLASYGSHNINGIVDLLLSKGASPDIANSKGSTPLHVASRPSAENLHLVGGLIVAGADLDKRNPEGRTSLHHAVLLGRTEIVRLLLEAGVSPQITDVDSCTPLLVENSCRTSREQRTNIVRQLIGAGAKVNANNNQGGTLLHRACARGDEEIVQMLLSNGASFTSVDSRGQNALLFAAESARIKCVQQLIKAGADIHYVRAQKSPGELGNDPRSDSPRTALHAAIASENVDMVKYLLEQGANPNQTNRLGDPTLCHVIFRVEETNARVKMLKLLLQYGADMYAVSVIRTLHPGFYGRYPVFELSVGRKFVKETRLLLEHGLDLGRYKPQTPQGFLPLHSAIGCWDSGDMLSLLMKYGAKDLLDIEHEDSYGHTPLHTAVYHGSPECVRILLDAGANVNHLNRERHNALGILSDSGVLGIFKPKSPPEGCIRLLVEAGVELGDIFEEFSPNTWADGTPDDAESESDYDDEGANENNSSRPGRYYSKRDPRCHLQRAKYIVKYRVLYESKNPSVQEPMELKIMGGPVKLRNYYEACRSEINLLKNSPIHNSITYYDVLVANDDFVKRVRDNSVYEEFDKNGIVKRFPLYARDTCNSFKCLKRKHEIWEKAVRKISQYAEFDSEGLYPILDNILSFLDENSLHSMAES